jgi:hypothetical protein
METKIHDLNSLHSRMVELRSECRKYETKMVERVTYYQENAGSILLESLLKSIMNINLKRMMYSWMGKEDNTPNSKSSETQNDLLHTSITLGLSLGLKYINKLFK